jgi:hypothetical protein
MVELGGDCDCGGFDGCVVMTELMVVVVMMMMMMMMFVVKVNLVITVVVVEEEIVGSIFRVKTAVTRCSETWASTCQNTQCQKPEGNNKFFTTLKLSNLILL